MADEDVTTEAGTPAERPTKLPKGLQPHDDDRGLDLTLRSTNGTTRTVTINEPSIRQLGKLQAIFAKVDKAAPKLPEMAPEDALRDPAWQEAVEKRRIWIYGGARGDSFPYGQAVLDAITLCSPEETVTLDDLPSWCANPLVAQALMTHFTLPLVGPVGQSA